MRVLILPALLLGACATTTDGKSELYEQAIGVVSADTALMSDGDYVSSAWISDAFDGTQTRDLRGNRLRFTVDNAHPSEGGWDGSVSLPEGVYGGVAVRDVGAGAVACTSYHVDMNRPDGAKSKWWAGPKISVNWTAMEDASAPGDWYENYVIETGSEDADAWERSMFSWADIEFIEESMVGGARYKHYKVRFNDWWQFWSVRQDQASASRVPVKPILEVWTRHGLPDDLLVDGVKANIETYGPMSATGQIAAEFNSGGLRAQSGSCDIPVPEVQGLVPS